MPGVLFTRLAADVPRRARDARSGVRACLLLFAVPLLLVTGMTAAEPMPLPPISGEITGKFTPLKLAGAPTLDWRLVLAPGGDAGQRRAQFEITVAGSSLRGEAVLDTFESATWRIAEGRVELGPWFSALAPLFGAGVKGISAEGLMLFSGEGVLRGTDVRGGLKLQVRDGVLRDAKAGWAVEGVGLHGRLAELPQLATDGPVTLTFRDASGAGMAARDGRIEFSVDRERRIHVHQAAMNLMGGSVELTPFLFDPTKPEVRTHAQFKRVELGRFAKFLPAVLADAKGPVSGRVELSWSAQDGLRSASGTLEPQDDVPATIRLAPSPGFLTSRLPENVREKIDLLPKWFGPIRKLFQPVNPAYSTLRAIEMGEAALEVNTLEMTVNPSGDPSGRSARVVVMATPAASESVVESVRFEINVTGPLADVLKLGLEGRFKVHTR